MKKVTALVLAVLILTTLALGAFATQVDPQIDFSGYSDSELVAFNAQLAMELAARKIEKTATIIPGRYLVGRDIPSGYYVITNNSGDTIFVAIFKDDLQYYKDSEAVDSYNFWDGESRFIMLQEGQIFESRHQTMQMTISPGVIFK